MHRSARTACSRRMWRFALIALVVWLAGSGIGTDALRAAAPARYAGTFRIESWRELEARGLFHFFYLHPSGHFLLAAEWPGHERSHFAGTWSVAGGRLHLTGRGAVVTNQGAWRTAFRREYRITVQDRGYRLAPLPEKNRYGLLGWPNAFQFFRRQPVPNLPGRPLPAQEDAIEAHIQALLAETG